jgi:hypothetical protein
MPEAETLEHFADETARRSAFLDEKDPVFPQGSTKLRKCIHRRIYAPADSKKHAPRARQQIVFPAKFRVKGVMQITS